MTLSEQFHMRTTMNQDRRSFLVNSSLAVLAAASPVSGAIAEAGPARMSDAALVADLGEYLQRLAARDAFSGTVLLARDERILFERAYGFANRAFRALNQLDTRLNIGSMGKMFTAVAVLQLAQQGKLRLDAPLSELVPDYPDREIARQVTVHQLLTHTSGFGNFFNARFAESSRARYRTTQSHLPLFQGEPLLFAPGSRWSYSNAGFIVLGLIIERVSGQTYYDYVREHVFKLAGMSSTDNYKVDDDIPNLALGYTYRGFDLGLHLDQPRRTNILMHVGRGSSSGGGYSTVGDLLRFSRALQGHRLLNKEHTELLTSGKVRTPRGDRYAYGITDRQLNDVRIVGHGGGFAGINGRLDMFPDLGYTVAVLSNYDEAAEPVGDRLRWLLTGGQIPRAVRLSPESSPAVAGKYVPAAADGGPPSPPLEIAVDGAGLWLNGAFRRRFSPLSATEYFSEDVPGDRLRFGVDARGRVIDVTMQRVSSGSPITASRVSDGA